MAVNGLILKGIGGFYYVKTAEGVLECKAKGIFRKRGETPLAGDRVAVEGDESGYVIGEIKPRINSFARPPIANVTCAFVVVSSVDPKPVTIVIDRMTAACVRAGVTPVIVLTKTDIEPLDSLAQVYRNAGFSVVDVHKEGEQALHELGELVDGGIAVVIGNSGVGKSTLLNNISSDLSLEVGETSKKLGRGKHTTRAVELYEFGKGYLADTPGFSSLETLRDGAMPEDVADWFPDIKKHAENCYFVNCSHVSEKGCEVLEALKEGKIEQSRHKNYTEIYAEIKNDYEHRYN